MPPKQPSGLAAGSPAACDARFAVGVAGIACGLQRGLVDNHALDHRGLGGVPGGFFFLDGLLGGKALGLDGRLGSQPLVLFALALGRAAVGFGLSKGFLLGDASLTGFGNAGALGAALKFVRIVLCGTGLEFFEQRLFGGNCRRAAISECIILGWWQVWCPIK